MNYQIPKNPETSFVVRTLNEEKWLGGVLKSLFSQTRLDHEVIIVDSGSTDRTLKIAKEFPIVKLIQIPQEEFNFSYALNTGIDQARGEFVSALSGHSVPINDLWYQAGIGNFQDPKVAAVTGYVHTLPDAKWFEKLGDFLLWPVKKNLKLSYVRTMTNSNSIIRKSLWEKIIHLTSG